MDFTFLSPGWLLLLGLLPLLAVFPRPGGLGRAVLLRALVGLLLIVALARPVTRNLSALEQHVLVLDHRGWGAGVEEDLARFAADWAAGLGPEAQGSLIEFGMQGAKDGQGLALDESLAGRLERSTLAQGQGLDAALAAGAARIPDGARGSLMVASAGLGAGLPASRGLADLQRRGIPVSSALPAIDSTPRPVGLELASPVRLGGSAQLRVRLAGQGSGLTVNLFSGDRNVASLEGVQVDGRGTLALAFEPERAGFLPLRLVLDGPGVDAGRQSFSATLPVDDPLRALYLGPEGGGDQAMAKLVGPGISLERPGAEGQGLDSFELVVVDDVKAEELPAELLASVAGAVTDGGLGLFACGARSAFGAGGWQDTPLADVLPVEALQKEEKRDPSVALAIVVDTSGSMGGNRVQLAKEVARLAMRRLLPHDKVGIVEFYGAKRWAAPLQPASNNIELERALNRLAAGGGTVILPAIEEAFYGLLNLDARFKHILVLTDGGVESGAFEPLLRRMASRGITTSTVLIGGDAHSEFLVTLANWGKGRFYAVPNRFNLPEILLKQPTSAKLSAWQPGSAAVTSGGGPGWWGDLDASAVPPVDGLVETRLKPGATSILETEEGTRPVLASWRHGLGRVTAMPLEPVGPGSTGWDAWPDYGRFLARTLERTAQDLAPFAFELERHAGRARLVALRRVSAQLQPAATLVRSGETVEFEERAPGRFEANWFCDPAQPLLVEAGAQGSPRVTRLAADALDELLLDPSGALDLTAVSAATGGTSQALAAAAPAPVAGGSGSLRGFRELRPWVLLLALIAYLFDVFDRRRARGPVTVR